MTPQEAQLVQLIARQVMEQLKEHLPLASQGGTHQPTSPEQGQRATVLPPVGTCTGDYSKYPELAGRLNLSEPSQAQAVQPAPRATLLTGFVTESQLREAIKLSPAGVAVLAHDAKLTPLGSDFARQFPEKIKRADQGSGAPVPASSGLADGRASGLPWYWWIQGQCPVVSQVTSQRTAQLRTMTAGNRASELGRVIRDLSRAVQTTQAQGGLLFVPSAARAVCMANRCANLRAIVGTCGQAVEQGIQELGANVLIVEYPHHGPRGMAGMVDSMLSQKPAVPTAVQRDLADLHRCG